MINVDRALKGDRMMKAVTGVSVSEFGELAPKFGQKLEYEKWDRYEQGVKQGDREREPEGGKKGNLRNTLEKLFFILLYFKYYPTFDLLGFLFDLNSSNACRNVKKLASILEMVLPKRRINTIAELFDILQIEDL